jgi:hypothetical protein
VAQIASSSCNSDDGHDEWVIGVNNRVCKCGQGTCRGTDEMKLKRLDRIFELLMLAWPTLLYSPRSSVISDVSRKSWAR